MAWQGLARLFTVAGITLASVAGGALLPGSTPVQAADVTIVTRAVTTSSPSTAPPTSTGTPTRTTAALPEPSAAGTTPTSPWLPTATDNDRPGHAGGEAPLPEIAPAAAQHITIPAIGVDADILPVDSRPTGQRNAWGGEIYSAIDFPVDDEVRQWVRRGDPNSLPADESADDIKAFDRTVLYGHASDIGNHLVFQDLAALRPGDEVEVATENGHFTYAVTTILTREKARLDNLAELYEYPQDGAKELALVACLPDTTSNVVVLATLIGAQTIA